MKALSVQVSKNLLKYYTICFQLSNRCRLKERRVGKEKRQGGIGIRMGMKEEKENIVVGKVRKQ
jgi:hypothetical protein